MEVNPSIIKWAMDWNNLTTDDLKPAFPKIDEWLDGTRQPTFKQLEKLAVKTHTIVPHFFAESIPDVRLQIADFRTPSGSAPKNPSPELFETIDVMLYRQGWMSDSFKDLGYGTVELVGHFNSIEDVDPSEAASYLNRFLGLHKNWAAIEAHSADEAVRHLRRAIEASRISVAIAGYAGGNTRRLFDVSEFRGFVLADEYAPLIFVNGRDAKTAQLFTLAHELAHLALGHTGLLNSPKDVLDADGHEDFCDKVAVEFLMPADVVIRIAEEESDSEKALATLRARTRTSTLASLRRLRELDIIDESRFWALYNTHVKNKAAIKPRKSGNGDYYTTKGSNLGQLFTDAVFAGVKTGRLLYADAYKLTGMHAQVFANYYQRKGYAL